jgi:hypothetical protein
VAEVIAFHRLHSLGSPGSSEASVVAPAAEALSTSTLAILVALEISWMLHGRTLVSPVKG